MTQRSSYLPAQNRRSAEERVRRPAEPVRPCAGKAVCPAENHLSGHLFAGSGPTDSRINPAPAAIKKPRSGVKFCTKKVALFWQKLLDTDAPVWYNTRVKKAAIGQKPRSPCGSQDSGLYRTRSASRQGCAFDESFARRLLRKQPRFCLPTNSIFIGGVSISLPKERRRNWRSTLPYATARFV